MKILDCTLRDGGYINNWRFNDKFIDNYINITNKYNDLIEYIEIGFINIKKEYKNELVGDLRNLSLSDIEMFKNKSNCKIAIMADLNNINMDLINNPELIKNIDLIRIAFHKKDLDKSISLCVKLKKMGYKVSLNIMATTNYTKDELIDLMEKVSIYNFDVIYIADSYGSLNQIALSNMINIIKAHETKIGIHLHNNMQNAISNFNSIQNNQNINLIDTTMFGMGRGAGNLPLETTVLTMNPLIDLNIFIELLNFIENYVKKNFYKSIIKWGYDLDYLLSGHLQIHPNYVSKMRDMDISFENRFNLLKIIYETHMGKLFDKNIMESLIFKNKKDLI